MSMTDLLCEKRRERLDGTPMTYGDALKYMMRIARKTPADLLRDCGVSRWSTDSYLKNQCFPNLHRANMICKYLGFKLEDWIAMVPEDMR